MANEQNLIPGAHKLTVEEASIGGKKSAEVRRARKTFREDFIEVLSDKQKQKELIDAMLNQAKKGNVKAFEIIRDTIGEKPRDNIEVETKLPILNIEVTDNKELKKKFGEYEANTETN